MDEQQNEDVAVCIFCKEGADSTTKGGLRPVYARIWNENGSASSFSHYVHLDCERF